MKLNWAERLVVNNPLRVIEQRFQIRRLRKAGVLEPGARVLEIGCGRGAGADLILDAFQPEMVFAMDLDERMIRKARTYLSPARRSRVAMYAGDAVDLPHRNGSMDAVFGFGVLHHIPDWQRGLAEVARVLRPGGVYFLEEIYPFLYQNPVTKHILLHPAGNRFRSADLHQALKEAGFSLIDSLEVKFAWVLAVLVKRGPAEA